MNKLPQFFENYLNTPAPTGFEHRGQRLWVEEMKKYADEVKTDAYGSAIATINPSAPFKVLIEAHVDEIGWNISYIDAKGYIYVQRNGGSDNITAPGKEVVIITEDDTEHKGVFGQTAIHMRDRNGGEKAIEVEDLFIDIGAESKEDVETKFNIHVGDKVVYPANADVFGGCNVKSKALDNKAGGYVLTEVAKALRESGVPESISVVFANCVQEEIGLRGAQMVADSVKPNVAIVTDVCHDTNTPGINQKKHGDISMGDGPVVSRAPSIHNGLRRFMIDVAENESIPFQRLSASSHSGTDADAIAYSNGGVPTVLLKMPLRYMHTPTEVACMDDINNTAKLITETVNKMVTFNDIALKTLVLNR
jgi:putative aminopeptidase FrvX